ncbi:MAG: M24 family metallopeptidase [Desulfatirhabdiaceae bacterium]
MNNPIHQPADNILPFPHSEFDERLKLVQSVLTEKKLAGYLLFDPENIYWLTGYQTIGYFTFQCLYVPTKGKPALVSRIVNRGLGLATPTIGNFVAIHDTDEPVDVLVNFLKQAVRDSHPIGIETCAWYLTVRDYQGIIGSMDTHFVPCNGIIEPYRIIKTDVQIERIRAAARAAEAGLAAAIKAVAPGKTENDLAAAMFQSTISNGSEYLGHPPLVVAGQRTAICFSMWRRNVIQKGDVILLEAAGCIDRYHAMVARSVVVGEPTKRHKEAADAIIGVLNAAIETIRPGISCGEADSSCRKIVEDLGLGHYFNHRAAYGIGIGFPPNWSEGRIYAIRPNDPTILKPNMTFHVVPTLFMEDFGMCFSESVRVTEDGCEVITDFPRKLFQVDV